VLRILAVDNEPSVLTSLRFVFGFPRYDLTTVKGGEEALAQLEKTGEPFDVIIVDQRMPHLTGSELVAAIRKRGVTSKIIVLSAHITEEMRRVYEQLDVQYIFEKPFDLTEFRAAVDAQGGEFTRWKTAIKLRDLPPKKDPRGGRRSCFNRAPLSQPNSRTTPDREQLIKWAKLITARAALARGSLSDQRSIPAHTGARLKVPAQAGLAPSRSQRRRLALDPNVFSVGDGEVLVAGG